MNGSGVVGSGERNRVFNAVPLQNAVLCAECDVVSDSPHDICLVCGSRFDADYSDRSARPDVLLREEPDEEQEEEEDEGNVTDDEGDDDEEDDQGYTVSMYHLCDEG